MMKMNKIYAFALITLLMSAAPVQMAHAGMFDGMIDGVKSWFVRREFRKAEKNAEMMASPIKEKWEKSSELGKLGLMLSLGGFAAALISKFSNGKINKKVVGGFLAGALGMFGIDLVSFAKGAAAVQVKGTKKLQKKINGAAKGVPGMKKLLRPTNDMFAVASKKCTKEWEKAVLDEYDLLHGYGSFHLLSPNRILNWRLRAQVLGDARAKLIAEHKAELEAAAAAKEVEVQG